MSGIRCPHRGIPANRLRRDGPLSSVGRKSLVRRTRWVIRFADVEHHAIADAVSIAEHVWDQRYRVYDGVNLNCGGTD